MRRITVFTKDGLLWRRLFLLLRGSYSVELRESSDASASNADISIVDTDCFPELGGDVLLSRRDGNGKISIPFALSELKDEVSKLEKRDTGGIRAVEGERAVRLRGELIRLTEVEYKVLSVLLRAPIGEYVSREQLIREVWGGECDGGVVNVYIHYLREKLEKNGEKIIISSRREGYKLDERIGR